MSDIEDITRKLEAFCAYQERCLFEVKVKLESFDLSDKQNAQIIESLQTNRFLNEKRFAEAYAQGKLRIKRWGKQKIKAGLFQKHVDSQLIKEALESLDDKDYLQALESLVAKKTQELKNEKDNWTKKQKIMRYLVSRGFSYEEIGQL